MTPREAIAKTWERIPDNQIVRGGDLADAILRTLREAGYAVVPRKITPEIATALDVTPGCDAADPSVTTATEYWGRAWEAALRAAKGDNAA